MFIQPAKRPLFLFFLFVLFAGSLAASVVYKIDGHDTLLVHEALQAFLDAFGGMAAISMALLLLHLHRDGEREKGEYFLLSMGFFMMGILDTCHAVSSAGHGLILLRGLANFFGGAWFVLVYFPSAGKFLGKIKLLRWVVPLVALALGIFTLSFRDFWPQMIQDHGFTIFAIGLNMISGCLLVLAALYFFFEFYRTSRTESYLFTCMFMLLGLAGCEFFLSKVWSDEWWLWHFERCLAYIIVFYYMLKTYQRAKEELRDLNEFLEERIAERTAALSVEVAERRRYGRERDKVVAELQEALARIKTLTGMLPTCASCKKIRDNEGNWVQMEYYIQNHSEAKFSHGICPDCVKKLYPEISNEILQDSTKHKRTP